MKTPMKTLDLLKIDVLDYYEQNGIPIDASLPEFLAVNQMKKRLLKERHDTYFGMEWNEAIEVIMLQNFNVIHEEKFMHDNKEESLLIFWDGACIIKLTSFTMTKKDVNSLDLFFNWYSSDKSRWEFHGSGGYIREGVWDKVNNKAIKVPQNIQDIWLKDEATELLKARDYGLIFGGRKDIREGFVAIITAMRERGTFITPWFSLEPLNLTHYGEKFEHKGQHEGCIEQYVKRYDEHRLARLSKLPIEVRKALGRE